MQADATRRPKKQIENMAVYPPLPLIVATKIVKRIEETAFAESIKEKTYGPLFNPNYCITRTAYKVIKTPLQLIKTTLDSMYVLQSAIEYYNVKM